MNDTLSDYYPYDFDYNDFQNYSDTGQYDYISRAHSPVEAGLPVVLAVLITVVNCLVLSVILSDRTLRTSPKYIQVLSLTLANLVYSTVVLPLQGEAAIRGSWVHDCELKEFVDLFDTYFHVALTWLGLSMLNVVILFLICTALFDKRARRAYISVALACLPWVMTCLGFIPLYRVVLEPLRIRGYPCAYVISPHRTLALLTLTYPLTGLFLIMTSFLTIVLVLYRRNVSCGGICPSRGDYRVPRGDPEDERREYICDVLVVCVLTVVLSFPVFIIRVFFNAKNNENMCTHEKECDLYAVTRIVHFVRVSCALVTPMVWFLGRDFRYSFLQLLKLGKPKKLEKG